MRIRARGLTDLGLVRKNNEDDLHVDEAARWLVVCDGMGGHASGELASSLAIDTFVHLLAAPGAPVLELARSRDPAAPRDAADLVSAARLANTRIFAVAAGDSAHRGMGTTLVAARFSTDGSVAVVNVGDARAYRLRAGELIRLTRDHTLLSDMIEDGELSAAEAASFREKNVLNRSLGTAPAVTVRLRVEPALPGDVYLLCTDGLHGVLDDEAIRLLMTGRPDDLEGLAASLVAEANRRGGPDNITVGLAVVDESPAAGAEAPLIVEVADNVSEFARRRRAIARLFKLPGRSSRTRVYAVAGAAAILVALVLVVLLVRPAKTGVRLGSLQVVVRPEAAARAARVMVNGIDVGSTRADSLRRDSSYRVSVESPGYAIWDSNVTVQADIDTLTATLERLRAKLQADFKNADSFMLQAASPDFDTTLFISSAMAVIDLPPGSYTIRFGWGRLRKQTRTYQCLLEPGKTVRLYPD